MPKLVIEHADFTLEIKSDKAYKRYELARMNLGDAALHCHYGFSVPCQKFYFCDFGDFKQVLFNDDEPASTNVEGVPFFFDYTDYCVTVLFRPESRPRGELDATLRTHLAEVNENSDYYPSAGFLTGFFNYGNDIGNSDLIINYVVNGERRSFNFSFQVLSVKLDYHSHWKTIVEDIENEYRLLALDFLKQTYHSFDRNSGGESSDLIWWNLFKTKHREFIKAVRFILSHPRRKVRGTVEYLRSDKVKRLTPQLENALAEHRIQPEYRYRCEENVLSNDTAENRFLKYAVSSIAGTFSKLADFIVANVGDRLSSLILAEMQADKEELKRLKNHQFFRTIGNFTGLLQESLVLQRAEGYSTVMRIYVLLKASYSLFTGEFSFESKNIAELYEIWCFMQVRNIVKELFGDAEIEDANRQELNGRFVRNLNTGGSSKVLFRKNGVELAELYYNPKTKDDNSDGIPNTIAPTWCGQKPDIVLQLSRQFPDNDTPIKLTYLFDAKYRLHNDGYCGFDRPPDDAINQMHRFRDAIYFQDEEQQKLKKEVIGGYILFPGKGEKGKNWEDQQFYKSIEKINIGAFPLRPCDKVNRRHLENFIKRLLDEKTIEHIEKNIPHKSQDAIPEIPPILRDQFIFTTMYDRTEFERIDTSWIYCLPVNECKTHFVSSSNAEKKKFLFVELRDEGVAMQPKIVPLLEFVGEKIGQEINALGWSLEKNAWELKFLVWKIMHEEPGQGWINQGIASAEDEVYSDERYEVPYRQAAQTGHIANVDTSLDDEWSKQK